MYWWKVPKPKLESINLDEFVKRVKEAVKGKNAATEILEAVKLLLAHYQIEKPQKGKEPKQAKQPKQEQQPDQDPKTE